ncbi:2-succinyl-5-enolpyruvyl-6-hydroxy-3-cyclohexene-1-carboxylic-acid synthase [Marisediminicola sp. LYQ134]|uniref:2-succinyl-5-enolpyruvyl-6-hydroxy-3- cyclohexene-1-carboxylic-acid synthase n=1 Tax=Marisediminicola sp. LYQ134 TaxID=3391061 RepID=UPI0039839AEF
MTGAPASSEFSLALLASLTTHGVTDVVVSPGSRSQALALAAAALSDAGALRLHVRIDERSAGFLALGLAVESGVPAVVITTSGTAVANLHPAVLEAHHSGVPLLVVSADRPPELRGIGSNQTTVQPGMFGAIPRWSADVDAPSGDAPAERTRAAELAARAVAATSGVTPGPVHLNIAFREPLSGAIDSDELDQAMRAAASGPAGSVEGEPGPAVDPELDLEPRDGTVVIAGHGAGAHAESLARALGAPLLAEVSSGARFGPNLVVAYRELLDDADFGGAVTRAVVFGHPTLSRQVPRLLQSDAVEVIVVRGHAGEAYDPGRRARRIVREVRYAGEPAPRSWAGSWVHASRAIVDGGHLSGAASAAVPLPSGDKEPSLAREQLAVFRQAITRRSLVDAVWHATWPHDRLVFGASRLIRDADRAVSGKNITVHANRGLAGIDGTVATATGIALASEAAGSTGVTRVVVGDVTMLHDVGSLLLAPGEPRPRLQVVVGNDGGGTIFDSLEVAGDSDPDAFDRVMYTPHAVDLRALAAAYGWEYRRADNRGELDEALAASGSVVLVEVPLPRH